jgi:hypothetical protein
VDVIFFLEILHKGKAALHTTADAGVAYADKEPCHMKRFCVGELDLAVYLK